AELTLPHAVCLWGVAVAAFVVAGIVPYGRGQHPPAGGALPALSLLHVIELARIQRVLRQLLGLEGLNLGQVDQQNDRQDHAEDGYGFNRSIHASSPSPLFCAAPCFSLDLSSFPPDLVPSSCTARRARA